MLALGAYLFGVSLVLTLVLTPLAMRLARRWGVLDHPDPRKIHKEPIPLAGGWAIFGSISIVLWGHLTAVWLVPAGALPAWVPAQRVEELGDLVLKILPVYGGAAAIFLLGLFDDVRGMSVKSRLWIQLLVAAGLVFAGVRPSLGMLPPWVAALIGIVWIAGITNAFNFLDGLDGLSAGVSLIATGALLCVLGMGSQPNVALFLAVLAGAQLAFLRYNWHPARVFLGSAGSMLLGFLMGVSTILTTFMVGGRENWLAPLLVPLFILAIPLYDTASVVLIRLLRRRSVAIGDQSHFHHRLMKLGFSHRQTVGFIWVIAFAVALGAIHLIGASLGPSALILAQIVAILSIIALAERVAGNVRAKLLDRAKLRREAETRRAEAFTD